MARRRFGTAPHLRRRYRNRRFGSYGMRGGYNPANVVTAQADFSYTGTALKRKNPKLASALRYKKKKWLRYKRKIKRAVAPPKTKVKFVYQYGRSWTADANDQAVALLPICSYRGTDALTANIASGSGSALSYTARADDASRIFQYYDNVLYPIASSTLAPENQNIKNISFGIKRATIDVTLTNAGVSTDGNSDVPIEYEIYMLWPKRKVGDNSVNMNLCNDWINQANKFSENRIGGDAINALGRAGPQDAYWKTWTTAYVSSYVKSKLIGRGYLGLGESTRFYKSVKTKFFTTRQKWENDSSDVIGLKSDPWLRGLTTYVMVVWRGTPKTGVLTGGWNRSRMNVNVQKEIDTWTSSAALQPGKQDGILNADNFST